MVGRRGCGCGTVSLFCPSTDSERAENDAEAKLRVVGEREETRVVAEGGGTFDVPLRVR